MSVQTARAKSMTMDNAATSRRLKKIGGKVAFYLLIFIICLYTVFPFYWAFISSLKPDNELFVLPVEYWPKNLTFDHYGAVLGDNLFQTALLNSATVALTVTLLSLLIGALAA